MLGDDLIRVATLARNRKSCTGVAATKGRHLGFAPDEANRRGGVPFLEKWGGSLAAVLIATYDCPSQRFQPRHFIAANNCWWGLRKNWDHRRHGGPDAHRQEASKP
jgi:hypothetical protein